MSIIDFWGKKHQSKTLYQSDLGDDMAKLRRFKIFNAHYMVKRDLENLDVLKINKNHNRRVKSLDISQAEKIDMKYTYVK